MLHDSVWIFPYFSFSYLIAIEIVFCPSDCGSPYYGNSTPNHFSSSPSLYLAPSIDIFGPFKYLDASSLPAKVNLHSNSLHNIIIIILLLLQVI